VLLLADVLLVADVLVLAEVLLLADVLLVDMLWPQGSSTGTHTLAGFPSALLIGVHAWPAGHTSPLVQSDAQYVSPANWAQTRPGPQDAVVTHPTQSAAPPAPAVPLEVVAVVEVVTPLAPPVPAELVGEPEPVVAPGPEVVCAPPGPVLFPAELQEAATATQPPSVKTWRTRMLGAQSFMARHGHVTNLQPQA
jgi:hypothetical protein